MNAFTGWHVMVLLLGVLLVAAVVAVAVASARSRSGHREEHVAGRTVQVGDVVRFRTVDDEEWMVVEVVDGGPVIGLTLDGGRVVCDPRVITVVPDDKANLAVLALRDRS